MSARDATMISRLVKTGGWLEALSTEERVAVVKRLIKTVTDEDSSNREVAAATKVLALLEKNDMEKAKLELHQEIGEIFDLEGFALSLTAAMVATRGRKPDESQSQS